MVSWARGVDAITLFVEDLEAAKRFYLEVFNLPLHFEDDDSAVFAFGSTLINLLKTTAASELIEPATVASREAGARFQLTVAVDDVDAVCADPAARGVALLKRTDGSALGSAHGQLPRSGWPRLGDRKVVRRARTPH